MSGCAQLLFFVGFFFFNIKKVKIQETHIPVSSLKFDCIRIEMKDFTTNLPVQDENA